jgi:hypothetical protein
MSELLGVDINDIVVSVIDAPTHAQRERQCGMSTFMVMGVANLPSREVTSKDRVSFIGGWWWWWC